jgi:hypothetical protein
MDFYGRYLEVSFRKEDNPGAVTRAPVGNGEFIALKAPDGESNGKSLDVIQALPIVQPPATALGSLSSVALSSEPALESLPAESLCVNPLERSFP